MKKILRKKIAVNSEAIKDMMKTFGCTRVTVFDALRYASFSPLAEDIRKKAADYGAILWEGTKYSYEA